MLSAGSGCHFGCRSFWRAAGFLAFGLLVSVPVACLGQAKGLAEVPLDAPPATYDKAIFLKPIGADQIAFLKGFEGKPSGDLMKDKQFKKVLHDNLPGVMLHYGRDTPLDDVVDMVFKGSTIPVEIRDGRYLLAAAANGPLPAKGFLWIDMQDGLFLGGFYFHPTNGEPTPSLTIFSKQIKVDALSMGQLPPAFAHDVALWSISAHAQFISTRYFIGSARKKILVEHDEDYCAPKTGLAVPPGGACATMNEQAADIDLNTAYYLDQTGHATNSTARMLASGSLNDFMALRTNRCGGVADPIGCRVHMTHEHIHSVVHGGRR